MLSTQTEEKDSYSGPGYVPNDPEQTLKNCQRTLLLRLTHLEVIKEKLKKEKSSFALTTEAREENKNIEKQLNNINLRIKTLAGEINALTKSYSTHIEEKDESADEKARQITKDAAKLIHNSGLTKGKIYDHVNDANDTLGSVSSTVIASDISDLKLLGKSYTLKLLENGESFNSAWQHGLDAMQDAVDADRRAGYGHLAFKYNQFNTVRYSDFFRRTLHSNSNYDSISIGKREEKGTISRSVGNGAIQSTGETYQETQYYLDSGSRDQVWPIDEMKNKTIEITNFYLTKDQLWVKLLTNNNNDITKTKEAFDQIEEYQKIIFKKYSSWFKNNQAAVYSYHQNAKKREKNNENTATVKSFMKALEKIEKKKELETGSLVNKFIVKVNLPDISENRLRLPDPTPSPKKTTDSGLFGRFFKNPEAAEDSNEERSVSRSQSNRKGS